MNKKDLDYNFLIKGGLVIGGLFIGLKIVNSLLTGLGLKKSEDEIKIDTDIKNNYASALEAFNPEYYLQAKAAGKSIQDISASSQEIIKKAVHNCIGYIYDDPQKCLAAFTANLKFKTQVSVVSHSFLNAYGETMLGYLANSLDTASQKDVLNQILEYVKYLPTGIK